MSITVASAAQAQSANDPLGEADDPVTDLAQDPGPTCVEATRQELGCDSRFTPIAKDGGEVGWTQVAGAVYCCPEASHPGYDPENTTSKVPETVDFYAVDFLNSENGLAGGAQCAEDPPPEKSSGDALTEYLRSCPRVPVLYRYSTPEGGFPAWRESYRGTSRGFVGGVTWIEKDVGAPRALAVGGDGCYPRREEDCHPDLAPPVDAADPIAGRGRVWTSDRGDDEWRELPIQGGMTGMTALDASPRPGDCGAGSECALAGGLKQIWTWQDRQFAQTPLTPHPQGECPTAQWSTNNPRCHEWRYRVRQIRFRPNPLGAFPIRSAAEVVTAGCCDSGATDDGKEPERDPRAENPRTLSLSGNDKKWSVNSISAATSAGPPEAQSIPDSFYALTFSSAEGSPALLATPGGPYRPGEAPPQFVGPQLTSDAGNVTKGGRPAPALTNARLVAGDGDVRGHLHYPVPASGPASGTYSGPDEPDMHMDWAVGGMRSSGRAAAYTTTSKAFLLDTPKPLDCPQGSDPLADQPGYTIQASGDTFVGTATQCKPEPNPDDTRSGALFGLSSYFLNAYTFDVQSAVGWAVGDRGAIVRQGVEGAAGSTLPPENRPRLGAPRRHEAPNREPFQGARPGLSDEPGTVPSLATQPPEKLREPGLIPYGSPNPDGLSLGNEDIREIAMSRDGSEGWAVGPYSDSYRTTIYRFDGVRWRRCGARTVEGAVAADPACQGLEPLVNLGPRGVKITAIARVPWEHDLDPRNDDQFEAVAIAEPSALVKGGTTGTQDLAAILRYKNGGWSIEREESKQLGETGPITEIAFTSSTEGWMVRPAGNDLSLYRFGEDGWASCRDGDCEAESGLLPFRDAASAQLTVAGKRVYLYGTRRCGASNDASAGLAPNWCPYIFYKNAGEPWKAAHNPKEDDPDNPRAHGKLKDLSVALGPDGSYNGWGVGEFAALRPAKFFSTKPADTEHETALIRSDRYGTSWSTVPATGAARDSLRQPEVTKSLSALTGGQVIALPGPKGRGPVFAAGLKHAPPVWFEPAAERWRVFPVPFPFNWEDLGSPLTTTDVRLAPDNVGGFWFVTRSSGGSVWFYRYSSTRPAPVFEEAAHPIRERITASAAGGDASFWVATSSDVLYRYDRATGWDRMGVPGWDPGRVVTNPSPAHAIAVGPDGEGVVVGAAGRIANVGPSGATLDPAAGVLCSSPGTKDQPPCGTGRRLEAVAVAPDGAAIAGGEYRSLLWRPGGGEFRAIEPPKAAPYATITGISMPSPERAWLVTDTGEVWAGSRDGAGAWSWRAEFKDGFGRILTRDEERTVQPLRAVALDGSGHGYAVGDKGTIIERTGAGDPPWRRVDAGSLDHLTTVTLGPGGRGALIGGHNGLLLTEQDGGFAPARMADFWDPTVASAQHPSLGGRIVGAALLPGHQPGQVEAWAASQHPAAGQHLRNPSPGFLLHYSSHPNEPLLAAGDSRVGALPDAPQGSSDALSFAAFGKSSCLNERQDNPCAELAGTNLTHEVIARRVRDDVLEKSRAKADFVLFTGDVGSHAGDGRPVNNAATPLRQSLIHDRWIEFIAEPLAAKARVPTFAALGGRDLSSRWETCVFTTCNPSTHQSNSLAGVNLAWRRSMAAMPEPWGSGDEATSHSGLEFTAVDSGELAVEPGDRSVGDPTGEVGDQTVPTGGAHTHYAFDVERDGEKLARVVVVDSSLKSVAGSDAVQNPIRGQLGWLRDVLSSTPEDVRKVVVSNTPTYSYGPGSGTDTQIDATVFESVLMAHDVDLVVSGRLGWNGLYYALVPGLHYPCPGSSYPASEPKGASACGSAQTSEAEKLAADAQKEGAAVIGDEAQGAGALPFVVASSAGGQFGPQGHDDGSAAEGFWRGYTKVQVEPGEDGRIVVEQRPVFDWIGLTGSKHVMRPRSKLLLNGFGREPAGIDAPLRYFQIDSPAVTHRYDLLLAKPDQPWLPISDSEAGIEADGPDPESGCGEYVCLDQDVGTVDSQSGQVTAGSGRHPGAYAIAMLSIGDTAATKPLYFEKSPSFRAAAAPTPTPTTNLTTAPPPPGVETPPIPQFNSPTFDAPPVPPPPALVPPAALAATQAQPPSPPVPPPAVPANPAPSPLDLSFAPTGLTIAPAASVIPPPAPPINPAPPGGARKEARQRQAAAQKGGADSGAEEQAGDNVDLAGGPENAHGVSMTRHESAYRRSSVTRSEPSFSVYSPRSDSSTGASTLLYGGGLTLAAFVLALGFATLRPTPRRREPELPAPAWSAARRDRR